MVSLLTTCRSLVGHFNRSACGYADLHTCQKNTGVSQLQLIQDVPTRWNSVYLMLDRLKNQKKALRLYEIEFSLPGKALLTSNDWNKIAKLAPILEQFHQFGYYIYIAYIYIITKPKNG